MDPCAAEPCMNAGTCYEVGDGNYACECLTFFIGVNCEQFFGKSMCSSNENESQTSLQERFKGGLEMFRDVTLQ